MQFELNENQRKVVNTTTKDYVRPTLRCVHIKKNIIEAANGFIFTQKKIDYQYDEELLIDRDEFINHKPTKFRRIVHYDSNSDETIIAMGKFTNIFKPYNGDFPNTEQLYPKKEPVFRIALSKIHLKTLIDSLDTDNEAIKFSFYGEHEPVVFQSNNETTKGCIMPMFVQW